MTAQLNVLTEWEPEDMRPGTIFVLENAGETGENGDPYWAVLACPSCGTLGLVTRKQVNGVVPVICGSAKCPATFVLHDEHIEMKKPN
ncbi:MAG: hypothetical protein ABI383_13140 [Acidobacteriaceae bacterium]